MENENDLTLAIGTAMKATRLLLAGLGLQAAFAAGDLAASPSSSVLMEPARVFTSNAVFQRDRPIPVFGVDASGATVAVTFGEQTARTSADAQGRWRVNLAPLPASAVPRTLRIQGTSRVALTNLLVGDVWLISGQSNAEFPLASATGGRSVIAAATNTLIRYFRFAGSPATTAAPWTPSDLARVNAGGYFAGAWEVSGPATAGAVSAVGYLFALHLQTNQAVPIGLIECAVGGSPALSWMPEAAIKASPRHQAVADRFPDADLVGPFTRTRLLQNLADWDRAGRPAPMPEHPYKPGACWRAGLAHIAPFALRGVLWYQGESDADCSPSLDYDTMSDWYLGTFARLVAAWRDAWEAPSLPFYFVQLPRLERPSWPWFRESQRRCALTIPNTAMAVAWDYGDSSNVHPANKLPVAHRLARIARALSYGEAIEWSGPIYRGQRVAGASIILDFDHATGGLVANDGRPLRLFEIAGADRRFFPASAVISNHAVIVSAPEVPQPVSVRYAWVPDGSINFFNGAGLPASPFRTAF